MRKVIKVVTTIVLGASVLGIAAPVVNADSTVNAPKLNSAEVEPTNPAIKKGDSIMVIVKDTKNQRVAVYNKNAKKTKRTVKMGSEFTAKAVKKVRSRKIVQIRKNDWLNRKDVTQN